MKFAEYIKETRAEMKHVTWPTRRQSIAYTILVIVISVGVGALLTAFDAFFLKIFENLVG